MSLSWRASFALLVLSIAGSLALMACGDSRGVHVEWKTREGFHIEARASEAGGGTYATIVYLTNESGATLKSARLRFRPSETRNAPLGFSIGTITNVPSSFEGAAQLWSLGDLEPGSRLAFPIRLWFSDQLSLAQGQSLQLIVELESPDLEQAVLSNPLTVRLQR